MSSLVNARESGSLLTLAERVNVALALHKQGSLDEALEAYNAIVEEVPPALQTSLYSNLGAILSQKGQYEAAAAAFTQAVVASPDNAQAHFNLAVTLTSKLNDHKVALKHCAISLRINAANHKALHLMANIMQELGRDEDAQRYFVKAEAVAAALLQTEAVTSPTSQLDWSALLSNNNKIGDVVATTIHENGEELTILMECVSERPLIYKIDSLLSDQECSLIIERARPMLEKSFVMGGDGETSAYRSSRNTWLAANDDVLPKLQRRLAALFKSPYEQFATKLEELQVVYYESGGEFRPHHDSSAFQTRHFTALIYLSSLAEGQGGETFFPHAPAKLSENDKFDTVSTEQSIKMAASLVSAEMQGLKIRPVRGSALIFANHLESKDGGQARIDTAAVHAGLPVGEGASKWVANYWIG